MDDVARNQWRLDLAPRCYVYARSFPSPALDLAFASGVRLSRIIAALVMALALVVAPLAVTPAFAAGAVVTVSTFGNSEAIGRTTFQAAAAGPSDPFSFKIDTSSGTAIEGTDFTGMHQTLFAPGASAGQNFAVGTFIQLTDDALIEGPETFTITVSAITGGATFSQTVITVTIADNDPTFSVNDVSVTEGNAGTSLATFTVTQNVASATTTSVGYATADSTANAGSDYTSASGTLTFAPGVVTQTVAVTVTGDLEDELDERFALNLTAPVNASVGDGQGFATILDDDIPAVSVGDVSVGEVAPTATFTVTLSVAPAATVSVDYTTVDGTAAAGLDYVATSGTLTFAPGVVTQTVPVTLTADTIDEADETFTLNLSAPVGAILADAQGVATLADDDPLPLLTISSTSTAPIEGATGSVTTITLTVTRAEASGRDITVDVAAVDGTATNAADFAASAATVTIPAGPGPASARYTVDILGDALVEGAEDFTVELSNPVNAILDAQPLATITIADDDLAAVAALSNAGTDSLPWAALAGLLLIGGLVIVAMTVRRRAS